MPKGVIRTVRPGTITATAQKHQALQLHLAKPHQWRPQVPLAMSAREEEPTSSPKAAKRTTLVADSVAEGSAPDPTT